MLFCVGKLKYPIEQDNFRLRNLSFFSIEYVYNSLKINSLNTFSVSKESEKRKQFSSQSY